MTTVSTVIAVSLLILFLLAVLSGYFIFFDLFLKIEAILNRILGWFATPFAALSDRYVRPKVKNILMFGVAFLAAAYVLVSFLTAADSYDCFQTIVFSTSIGAVAELFNEGFHLKDQIAYSGLVAVAFGSFLSYVYMKFTISNLDSLHLNKVLRWLLFVLLNVLFIAFSSLLAEHMTVFFSKAGNMLSGLYNRLSGKVSNTSVNTFWDAFPMVGCYILLIPILIAIFLTTVITVREYLANIFYGLATLLLMIAVSLLADWLLADMLHIPELIGEILLVLSMFAVDYIRADEKANEWFTLLIERIAYEAKDLLRDLFRK